MKHIRVILAALVAGIVFASIVGCSQDTAALHREEKARLGAWLALNVAAIDPPQSVPSPDKPDHGDLCEDCGGTGKLPGDGRIRPTCQTCGGTGRKKPAAFDSPASTAAFEAAAKPAPPAPRDGRTYRKVLRGDSWVWELVHERKP